MSDNPRDPVVVGVDASEAALRTVRFAAEEARLRRAPLRIVHAVQFPSEATARRLGELDVPGLLRDGARGVVEWATEAAAATIDRAAVSAAVVDGDPLHALREASADAQLVVVGSRGLGGLAGLLLGSTASGLAGNAHCPVVVLPDETTVAVEGRRTVVVGVDGDPADEHVLRFALTEAAARGTDLLAVHAWQDAVLESAIRTTGPMVDWAGVQAEEERVLSEALAGCADKEPDVVVRETVVRDKPARALVAAAMTAQLLVVGHHARRALGSTTHGVLHRATCPVAIVPLPAHPHR
jgi:nucleotide-binding universal stress UspA family protein